MTGTVKDQTILSWVDALIERNEAAVRSRPEIKRTMKWWQQHFDADVHVRFGFEGPVLDVGCGTGEKDILFARARLEVYGFDGGRFCIETACNHRDQEPPEVRERLHFELADIRRPWPYPNGFFSTVFSSDVLEHLPAEYSAHFFQEIRRVLKPGGAALVIVPQGTAWDDPSHLQRFDAEQIRTLAEDFVNVQIIVVNERIHLWTGRVKDPTIPAYQALLYAIVRGTRAQLVYEVGVRAGYSTIAILEALDKTGGRLISCDITDCDAVIQDDRLRARWTFCQMDSKQFVSTLAVPADVIYIDGSHEYPDVRDDVIGMWPLLKTGGVMILHDTLSFPRGPGRVLTWLQHRGIEAVNLPFTNGFGLVHKNREGLLQEV